MSLFRQLGMALLVAATSASPAPAQSRQRVYVPPQTVKVGFLGGIVKGHCLDREIKGAPGSGDAIDKFGSPQDILIRRKDHGGRLIATQRWSDVLAGKEEPWVEFRGASDITFAIDLQVKVIHHDPASYLEVEFARGMPAARPQEQITPDLIKAVDLHARPIEKMARLSDEFRIFEAGSPLRDFAGRYAADVHWRATEGVAPDRSEARIGQFLDGLLDLARGDSPEYTRLAATYLGGRVVPGSPRAEYFKAHGLDVGAKVSPALERAALNLRVAMAGRERAAGDAYSKGADRLPAETARDVRDAINLMLRWDRAEIPVGDGQQVLRALAVERSPRLGIEARAGEFSFKQGDEVLDIAGLQDAIDRGSKVLREDNKLTELRQELGRSSLPDDPEARQIMIDATIDTTMNLGLVNSLYFKNGKFQGGPDEVFDRLSFRLMRIARLLKESGHIPPPRLAEVAAGLDRVPASWLDRIAGQRLVDVSRGLTDAEIRDLSRDLADLEASTGVGFTLAFNESSNFRASAARNGGDVAITADASMKRTDVPAITTSLFEHLVALAGRLKAEGGKVQILVAHNEGQSSYETWMGMMRQGDFAHKQWILGPCPFKDVSQQYDLLRSAVDPEVGKAISVVASTELVDLTCFTMAVDSMTKVPTRQRLDLTPIEFLREGYARSWTRLEKCLKAEDKAGRDAAIVEEFGEKIAPGIIERLDNGKEDLGWRLRHQARLFNSIAANLAPRYCLAS